MTPAISLPLQIKLLDNYPVKEPPAYATSGASGMDLRAAEDLLLVKGGIGLVACGFQMSMPLGWEAQVRPRSGLALKHGLVLPNSPGTIDADYRGEVKVIMMNLGAEDFSIRRGDRIAQLVICSVAQVLWNIVTDLDESQRAGGGFGSTGTS